MVNVFKTFEPVPTLAGDGGNYKIWLNRVSIAAAAVGGSGLLKAGPSGTPTDLLAPQLYAAITAKIHDSIFTLVAKFEHTHEVLQFLASRFRQTTPVVIAHAKELLFTARCAGDVQKHLDHLLRLKDDLADYDEEIDDTTFVDIIISSLPESYRPIVTAFQAALDAQNAIGRFLKPSTHQDVILESDTLITKIRAEAMTQALVKAQDATPKVSKHDDASEAAASAPHPEPSRQRPSRTPFRCWNCNGLGHRAAQCPSPAKGEGDDEDDPSTVADGDEEKSTRTEPQPQDQSSDEDEETAEASASSAPTVTSDAWALAAMEEDSKAPSGRTVIFDTGASRHISPYRDEFINFRPIAPHPIRTANRQTVYAEGVGDLLIEAPLNGGWTKIRLKDVLYAPSAHATLISLGRFDRAGFSVTLEDRQLTLRAPTQQLLAIVDQVDGLYLVRHEGGLGPTDHTDRAPVEGELKTGKDAKSREGDGTTTASAPSALPAGSAHFTQHAPVEGERKTTSALRADDADSVHRAPVEGERRTVTPSATRSHSVDGHTRATTTGANSAGIPENTKHGAEVKTRENNATKTLKQDTQHRAPRSAAAGKTTQHDLGWRTRAPPLSPAQDRAHPRAWPPHSHRTFPDAFAPSRAHPHRRPRRRRRHPTQILDQDDIPHPPPATTTTFGLGPNPPRRSRHQRATALAHAQRDFDSVHALDTHRDHGEDTPAAPLKKAPDIDDSNRQDFAQPHAGARAHDYGQVATVCHSHSPRLVGECWSLAFRR